MKKFITILIMGLITLTLVACAEDVNARATFPNAGLEISGTRISFRVNLIDPDEILTDGVIVVHMTGPNVDETQELDSWVAGNWRRFTFEDLTPGDTFSVTVTAETVYDGTITLASRDFETVEVGAADDVPVPISTPEEFFDMASIRTSTHFELVNDIDFEGAQAPIMFNASNRFIHHLEGNGYTLRNINQTDAEIVNNAYISIFGFIRDGSIRNLVLDNVTIDNSANPSTTILYAGILASRIDSINAVIDNVTIKNSTLNVHHNYQLRDGELRPTATARNLFLGSVIGAAQGTITNITVVDTKVDVNISNLATGLTAIAGTHIGGAIGLIETNRGQAFYNLDVDVDLSVTIDASRTGAEPALLNIGGVIGFHRGMHAVAAIALSNVVARGTVDVDINARAGTGTRRIWAGIGGVVGNFDPQQAIINIVALNDITLSTAPSDSTSALQTIFVGGLIGRTRSATTMIRGAVSYGQAIVVNSTSVAISEENPALIVTAIVDLINIERSGYVIDYDTVSIRHIGSSITINQTLATIDFLAITIDEIGTYITDQWVLDRL